MCAWRVISLRNTYIFGCLIGSTQINWFSKLWHSSIENFKRKWNGVSWAGICNKTLHHPCRWPNRPWSRKWVFIVLQNVIDFALLGRCPSQLWTQGHPKTFSCLRERMSWCSPPFHKHRHIQDWPWMHAINLHMMNHVPAESYTVNDVIFYIYTPWDFFFASRLTVANVFPGSLSILLLQQQFDLQLGDSVHLCACKALSANFWRSNFF